MCGDSFDHVIDVPCFPLDVLIVTLSSFLCSCWSSSLDNVMKRHTEKSTKHWFSVYQLVERYLLEQSQDADPGADEQVEQLSLLSVSSTLQAFMEGSTLGQFHTRLAMLLSFHCHLLLVPSQPGRGASAQQRPCWLHAVTAGKKINSPNPKASLICRPTIWPSGSGFCLPIR